MKSRIVIEKLHLIRPESQSIENHTIYLKVIRFRFA